MDTLFLLKPGFADPACPGKTFYCRHCALVEGVLASRPEAAARLDVRRIAWPRPRREVAELIGEARQSLPVLVLAPGRRSEHATGEAGGRVFIDDIDALLRALTARYGFAEPHP